MNQFRVLNEMRRYWVNRCFSRVQKECKKRNAQTRSTNDLFVNQVNWDNNTLLAYKKILFDALDTSILQINWKMDNCKLEVENAFLSISHPNWKTELMFATYRLMKWQFNDWWVEWVATVYVTSWAASTSPTRLL